MTERRQAENGLGRRDYDKCKNCSEHSGIEKSIDYLEREQKDVKEEVKKVKNLMLTSAVMVVITMIGAVGSLIVLLANTPKP